MTTHQRLAQLGGMIRYEMLLYWRQRGILVMVLSLLVLFIPITIQTSTGSTIAQLYKTGLSEADIREKVALGFGMTLWPVIQLMFLVLAPMIAADGIAKDRQYGVSETLNALPLNTITYLLGKLIGLALSILAGLAFVMVILGLVWHLVVGPFALSTYLSLWIFAALPMAILNPGMGLLLASGQSRRRIALLIGFGFAILTVFLLGASSGTFMGGTLSLWDYFNPARPLLLLHFTFTPDLSSVFKPVTNNDMLLSWLTGTLEFIVLAVIAWWWMRHQQNQ